MLLNTTLSVRKVRDIERSNRKEVRKIKRKGEGEQEGETEGEEIKKGKRK